MSRSSEAVKRWRKNTKQRMIDSLGGKCQICGYNKCPDALVFHHVNPEEKELAFGGIRGSPVSWKRIVEELRKCILLCCRCHAEVHDGMTQIPKKFQKFEESYVEYKQLRNIVS